MMAGVSYVDMCIPPGTLFRCRTADTSVGSMLLRIPPAAVPTLCQATVAVRNLEHVTISLRSATWRRPSPATPPAAAPPSARAASRRARCAAARRDRPARGRRRHRSTRSANSRVWSAHVAAGERRLAGARQHVVREQVGRRARAARRCDRPGPSRPPSRARAWTTSGWSSGLGTRRRGRAARIRGCVRRAPACAAAGPCGRSPRTTAAARARPRRARRGAPRAGRHAATAAGGRATRRRTRRRPRTATGRARRARAATRRQRTRSRRAQQPGERRDAVGGDAEHLVAALAVDQRPAPDRLDERDVAGDRRRPDDAVRRAGARWRSGRRRRARRGSSTRCQSPSPRCRTTVSCHSCSSASGDVGEHPGDRHRLGQPVAPGDVRRDGEHQRRVPPAREGDAARRPRAAPSQHDPFERLPRALVASDRSAAAASRRGRQT